MTDKNTAGPGSFPRLDLIVDRGLLAQFFVLLQQGVKVRRRAGCSVEAFLREEIGAAPETIERIQSIMLDGRPVDDIRAAIVHDGSTLALSAAMPGLVGATLRRGGAYASFRSSITYHEEGQRRDLAEGWVTIKVFNLLMAELGPALFRKGVLIRAAGLRAVLRDHARDLRQGCSVMLNGRSSDLAGLGKTAGLAAADNVFLFLSSGTTGT